MSTEMTSEGGHGAVPTGPGVPVEPQPSLSRRDWPLYEVFVRGKRGLNHVHVGSLHALGGPGRRHHRVQPGREGPDVRPER
jgi:ring-1,2-phenylacetyl-CoA epoxidase subunit PaaB